MASPGSTGGSFLAFVVYEAAALLFSLGVYLRLATGPARAGAAPMAAALAVSLAAGVVQASSVGPVRLVWDFDHNGVFHLVQLVGLALLADRTSPAPRFDRLRIHARCASPPTWRPCSIATSAPSGASSRPIPMSGRSGSRSRVCPTPAGTLALHLAGNLQHYVGARWGGTGYVRDRDAEFARRDVPRAELIAEIERARAAVAAGLGAVGAEAARRGRIPSSSRGCRIRTGDFLVHTAVHLAYHLGQLDAHRRVVTGNAEGVGAVKPAELGSARKD